MAGSKTGNGIAKKSSVAPAKKGFLARAKGAIKSAAGAVGNFFRRRG